MRNDQDFNQGFIERTGVSLQDSQQFKNGDLQEGILHTSNLILSVVLLDEHGVGLFKFRDVIDNILYERFVQTDDVFQEGHRAEKHAMVLLFEARQHLWQEFSDILRALLDDSDGSQNGFLSNVSAVVADTFQDLIVQLSCQLGGTNLTDDAQNQADDAVVGACQVDSQSISSHH